MRSIERYLLGWVLGALGVGVFVVALVIYLVTLDEMNEVYDADLKNVAEALGSYQYVGRTADTEAQRRFPVRLDKPDAAEIVTITWTHDGRRVYSSDPRIAIPFISKEALTRTTVGPDEWYVYTDVSPNGVAQAAQRVSARHNIAAESASKIFPPMIALSLLFCGLMVFALRRGLKPLDDAARSVADRSAKSLDAMALGEVPREISPLVLAINGLLAKLAEALSSQRRFLADAAHELRTPVTALQLQLQLLKRANDETSRRAAMGELESGIARSRRLVEQLLQVARAEPDAPLAPPAPVDLGALVRSAVGSLSVKADHQGIDLGANAAAHVAVLGDGGQLTVLLNNLVENALRYTPEGGVIDVEAMLQDGQPVLRVVDNGPGIAAAERARVFDRFYRGEDAQALARDSGGSGLGLSIVHAIAERHGATVSLHTPAGGQGLEVRVVFAAPRG